MRGATRTCTLEMLCDPGDNVDAKALWWSISMPFS